MFLLCLNFKPIPITLLSIIKILFCYTSLLFAQQSYTGSQSANSILLFTLKNNFQTTHSPFVSILVIKNKWICKDSKKTNMNI